jgi:molybdopterin-containing oxidoreductase family iron-sulfur binding subunit
VHKHIHPNLIAVPLGLGRSKGNRFARGVGAHGASILPNAGLAVPETYLVRVASIKKSTKSEALIEALGHKSQEKRGLIREKHEHDHGQDHHHPHDERFPSHEEHKPHALGPHKQKRQMYKQMEHVGYRWGMSIDLAKCIGCSACVVACYAENNIPVVGKKYAAEGREMSWLRIDHYEDGPEDRPISGFMPMMCQHCNNAPCEPVCPVYATYHNEDGLNAMIYNRCVGTRYCSNNCSYKARRFNWFGYEWPEPMTWQLNPDVTVREVGIMEKCTFCVQRISEAKNNAKNNGVQVQDGEVLPACASSCPTKAISFGNLLDEKSQVYRNSQKDRAYKALDAELNTQPAISYLAKAAKPGHGKGKA